MAMAQTIPWRQWIDGVEKGEPADGAGLDLAIVVLNYNTRELLRACLESVYASHGSFCFTLCVVDNASQVRVRTLCT